MNEISKIVKDSQRNLLKTGKIYKNKRGRKSMRILFNRKWTQAEISKIRTTEEFTGSNLYNAYILI